VNLIPFFAKESKLGVFTIGLPAHPRVSWRQSSAYRIRIFNGFSVAAFKYCGMFIARMKNIKTSRKFDIN
jgi:hypothetical protein